MMSIVSGDCFCTDSGNHNRSGNYADVLNQEVQRIYI